MKPKPLRRTFHLVLALALPVLGLPAQATKVQSARKVPKSPNPLIEAGTWNRILHEGKENSRVMDFLDHLVNRIGPRLTGSDGYRNACEWARDELRDMGYANARLEKWGTFPVGFNRGPWFGEITAPEGMRRGLQFNTMAWSAGTRGRQEGPVRIAPKTLEEAEKRRQDLKGAWLLASMRRRRRSGSSLRLRKFLEEAGALGLIHSTPGTLLRTGGNYRIRWEDLPRFPSVTLLQAQYREIHRAVKAGTKVRVAFDIRNWFKKGPIDLMNVMAELEGHEKPGEVVIVGGHIDSWDGATGTIDNGTGVSSTLEAARILMASGAKPRRTIRFMLWGGEEQGLLGSGSYVNAHRPELREKCSAVFVHDGGTNHVAGIRAPEEMLPQIRLAFQGFPAIDPAFPFAVGKGGMGGRGGSDHASFIRIGVPGFYWVQRGRAVYTEGWHTQKDLYDLAIPEYQKQTATIVALGALAVANLDRMLPRVSPRARSQAFDPQNPRLGVFMDETKITQVLPGTLAHHSGLKAEDELLRLAGTRIRARGDIGKALRLWVRKGMKAAKMEIRRKGRTLRLPLKTGQKKNAKAPKKRRKAG